MAESQQPLAVRVYSDVLKVQKIQTSNSSEFYDAFNSFLFVGQIEKYSGRNDMKLLDMK